MTRKAGYYAAKLNAEYEFVDGKITTEAYLDPLNNWTGPGGVLVKEDGTRVQKGDRWSEEAALMLYARRFDEYAAEVDEITRGHVVLNDFQFDALVVFNWNMGADTLVDSSIMAALRGDPPRFSEAASRFKLYRRATLWAGRPGPDGQVARGPDDKPLPPGWSWFKAMNGILRRSYATACLFKGLDWSEATHPSRVKIVKTPRRVEEEKRFVDQVHDQTSWKSVLDVARLHPLEPAPRRTEASVHTVILPAEETERPAVIETPPVANEAPPVASPPVPEPQVPAAEPRKAEETAEPAPPAKAPVEPYREYDPHRPAKSQLLSKRFYGYYLIVTGWLTFWARALAEMPFVTELASMSPLSVDSGYMIPLILGAGFLLLWVGQVKAKGPLR